MIFNKESRTYTKDTLKWHQNKIVNIMRKYDGYIYMTEDETRDDYNTYSTLARPYKNLLYDNIFVTAGTKTLNAKTRHGKIRDRDFVLAIAATYHELGHIILKTAIYPKENLSNSNLLNAAKVSVASHFLDEYRDNGYSNLPEEIICEIFSYKCLEKHFEKYPIRSNIKWKSIIINDVITNSTLLTEEDNQLKKNITSYKTVIAAFEEKLKIVFDKRKRINSGVYADEMHTREFDELFKEGIIQQIVDENCTGDKEIEILNNYIAKHHPTFFKGFTCIEELYDVEYPLDYQTRHPGNTFGEPNPDAISANNKVYDKDELELILYSVGQSSSQLQSKPDKKKSTAYISPLPKYVGTPTADDTPESPGTYSDGKPMPKPAPEHKPNDNFEPDY